MVAAPPGPRLPIEAVTSPFSPTFGPLQEPRLELQETNVVPFGSGSFTTTLVAAPGPLFVATMV